MEAAAHSHHEHHHHHEMPTSGGALTRVALSATLHCLTGCAIGEVLGMIIGTALGFSTLGTIALAVTLAFLFGYGLTSLPLLRSGMALSAVIPIALASDTLSIATMEIVDNGIMLIVPGAMESGLGSPLFWGSLSFALVIAGAVALPVNRWLIARGRGHAVVHETGIHGGPSPRVVGAVAAVAFVFGSGVLIAEAIGDGEAADPVRGGGMAMEEPGGHGSGGAAESEEPAGQGQDVGHAAADDVRGLAVSANGLTLKLEDTALERGQRDQLRFRVLDDSGAAVRDFEVEHAKRLHLIVVRRDFEGFQHLHPSMDDDGTWNADLTVAEAGSYRVFADFKRDGRNETLAADFSVDGSVSWQPLPAATTVARADGGYEVKMSADGGRAGEEAALKFAVTRDGEPVAVEPYLDARGHLVALREGDLAYLHVHPLDDRQRGAGPIEFATTFPTSGRYRLYLQFKAEGRVHTASFTREVGR